MYSLGLVLLEAITGMREFPGPMLEALTARMLRDPVIPDALHSRWATLLAAMTAREPADRPTAEQVHELALGLVADRVPTSSDEAATTLPMPTSSLATEGATPPMVAATVPLSAATATRSRRRRPRRVAVGIVAAAVGAAAIALAAVALQPTTASNPPAEVADVSEPAVDPSPTEPPGPTEPTVADPVTPTEVAPSVAPAPVPAVDPGTGSSGTGNSGNGNGNGNGNGANGNGSNGNGNGNGNGNDGNG